jgi:hypothetical protein
MDSLYIIQSDKSGAIKIGRSKNPQQRLKQLQTGSPFRLKILLILEGKGSIEKQLHRRLNEYKQDCKGEWFDFNSTGSLPDWIYDKINWDIANSWWEE